MTAESESLGWERPCPTHQALIAGLQEIEARGGQENIEEGEALVLLAEIHDLAHEMLKAQELARGD